MELAFLINKFKNEFGDFTNKQGKFNKAIIFGLWPVMKTYRGIVGTKNILLIAQMCWVSLHVLFYQRFLE